MINKYQGATFKSKYGDIKIIEFVKYDKVLVRFINSGYETHANMDAIKTGQVRDKLSTLVKGVGINNGKYPTRIDGQKLLEYRVWENMLLRGCDKKFKKDNQSYNNVGVSDNFLRYDFFYEWCQNQDGFREQDWQLDKDLRGGDVYSEDTCVFLPRRVNNLLATNLRKGYYTSKRGKFVVDMVCDGKSVVKSFDNELDCKLFASEVRKCNTISILGDFRDKLSPNIYTELLNKFNLLED